MLNIEKFKSEILDLTHKGHLIAVINGKPERCLGMNCQNCEFSKNEKVCNCTAKLIDWFCADYQEPIELSRLEYELCKYLQNKGYAYLARDKDGSLFAYKAVPEQYSEVWLSKASPYEALNFFEEIFKFVHWEDEKPVSIESFLNNYKIKEE